MNKLKIAITITGFATACLAILSLLLPVPNNWDGGWIMFHVRIMIALLIPALHILAALFFFRGLESFKQDLKVAYRLIATGIIVMGFAFFISPMVTFFDLWDTWFMTLGVPNVPFAVAIAIIFAGVRLIFNSLPIKSVWRLPWVNALFVVAGIILIILIPHVPNSISEFEFDFGNAMYALSVLMLTMTGINIFVIRGHITPAYGRVLTWLGAAMLVVASLIATSIVFRALNLDPRLAGNLQDFLILSATPYLVSGYLFYQLTADVREVKAQVGASAVDVVFYVASLATSAQKIDNILDDFRKITASIQPGRPLTDSEQLELAHVYIRLEHYLVTDEPQRSFTQEQLRQLVYQKFNVGDTSQQNRTFWGQLPPTGVTV